MVAGHTKDLTIDPARQSSRSRGGCPPDALPGSVLGSLRALAGEAAITKIESLMKHRKIVAYEPQVGNREKALGNSGRTGWPKTGS
jgi:hypothetical protein